MANELNFDGIEDAYFLIGEITAFSNRFQAVADRAFDGITWKQCFALVCIKMFEQPPTLNELSEVLGSSHQNVKQLLLKLERAGLIVFVRDEADGRKQRIILTEKAVEFDNGHAQVSEAYMKSLFSDIDAEKLKTTIETIVHMEQNLKKMEKLL